MRGGGGQEPHWGREAPGPGKLDQGALGIVVCGDHLIRRRVGRQRGRATGVLLTWPRGHGAGLGAGWADRPLDGPRIGILTTGRHGGGGGVGHQLPGLGVAGGGVIMQRENGLTGSCREGEILLLAGSCGSLGGSCSSWVDHVGVAGEGAWHLQTGRGEQLLILLVLELELIAVNSLNIEILT